MKYFDPDGLSDTEDILIDDPKEIGNILNNLGKNVESFKVVSELAMEYFISVDKLVFVGEKPEKGNPDFSADTPEKEIIYYSECPDYELIITEKDFSYFDSKPGWNYEHCIRGYEFKFKIGTYTILFYDVNKDGWIDFKEER